MNDIYVPSLESHIYTEPDDIGGVSIESLGVVSLLDIDDIYAAESFLQETSMATRKEQIMAKLCHDAGSYDSFITPTVFFVNNERHWHFNVTGLYFDEYVKNAFVYLAHIKDGNTLRLFFDESYPVDYFVLQYTAPIFNSLKNTTAKTVGMCYSTLCPMSTLLILGCDEIEIGEFGSISFSTIPYDSWGKYKIFKEGTDSMYESFVKRGILTEAERKQLDTEPNFSLILDSAELRKRLGQV